MIIAVSRKESCSVECLFAYKLAFYVGIHFHRCFSGSSNFFRKPYLVLVCKNVRRLKSGVKVLYFYSSVEWSLKHGYQWYILAVWGQKKLQLMHNAIQKLYSFLGRYFVKRVFPKLEQVHSMQKLLEKFLKLLKCLTRKNKNHSDLDLVFDLVWQSPKWK